jgi:hypothetical protein
VTSGINNTRKTDDRRTQLVALPYGWSAKIACLTFAVLSAITTVTAEQPAFEPQRLPAAVRDVPLDHLSSGALLRLDRGGDLVESPEAWTARVRELASVNARKRKAAVALDFRVSPNIRLGDDPGELPQNLRAQSEPHIIRAPNDPDFLLAIFQEGRTTTGGAADCGYAVSHDGGLTWRRSLIPKLGKPGGGPFVVASDPVAGIAADGTAYLNTLGVRSQEPLTGAAVVSRSLDGGATFEPPVIAYESPNNEFFPDKNWMAINTFPATATAGRIVVTFTLFSNTGGTSRPIARVLSDDKGQTWNAPAFIHDPNTDSQGSQPVFLPDGRLAISYWNFNKTPQTNVDDFIEFVISEDGGDTFGPPTFVTTVAIYDHPRIRDAVVLPSMTASRGSGDLFIVYQARHAGSPRIMFTKSTDGGASWTAPIPISDNPAGLAVINPTVAASPDGQKIDVAFYDARDNPNSPTLLDMYLAQSFDGGATWQPNIRLTPVSTDAALAPMSGNNPNNPNFMLGDYQGIAESTNENVPAVPLWIDTRSGNPDPFVARIGSSPTVNFTAWQASRLSLGQINDPAAGGEAGDADRDGEQNAAEFKYGTEPNEPLSVFHTGRVINISTRARVLTGENILIGGFIITGNEAKQVIVRAIGPSTAQLGVAGPLQDPTLELFDRAGASIAANDDWRATQQAEIEASGVAPSDSRESAILRSLAPGEYTAAVKGKNDTTGVAVVDVFDLAPTANPQLANISTRSFVDTDENVMIGGFIVGAGEGVGAAGSARVLIRGIGPSLAQSGVNGALQDPELVLFNGNGEVLAANDDWRQAQQGEIEATGIAPGDTREPAIVARLAHGSYTAIVRGKERATGVALVEAYKLP